MVCLLTMIVIVVSGSFRISLCCTLFMSCLMEEKKLLLG